jgi:hypothetical protein
VYARLRDNVGWASTAFTDRIILDLSAPTITSLTQTPEDEIQPYQDVKLVVNVTAKPSGVSEVTLVYSLNQSGTWIDLPMTLNETTNLYETTIPGQSIGTSVQYKIVASDRAGNQAISDNGGYDYTYIVVSELSPILMQLVLIVFAAFVCATRKLGKKTQVTLEST